MISPQCCLELNVILMMMKYDEIIISFFVVYFFAGMKDELSMSFKQKDNIMKMYGHQEPIPKIPVVNTLPEVGSSTLNGTLIREITMIHNTLKTHGNIENTELTLMSRTFANIAICNGNVKERGSALKLIVDVIMGEGPLNVAKAHLTLPLVALLALLHLPHSLRGYPAIQTAVFAADPLKEVAAAVQSLHPDLRNLKRHVLKGTIKWTNLRRIESLRLKEGIWLRRKSGLDEKIEGTRTKVRNSGLRNSKSHHLLSSHVKWNLNLKEM